MEEIKKVILDTDLGSDVDDVGALALANIFHNEKLINLLCVTHTTSSESGPLICEAINNFYHNEDIPLGVYKGPSFLEKDPVDSYNQETVNHWKHIAKSKDEYIDSIKLLRKTLASNNNVTLVFIGQLINLYLLMKSSPDEYSPLTGEELINKSVNDIYIMGGCFPKETNINRGLDGGEYNLVTALKESIYVINNLKVRTHYIDFTLGVDINTGSKIVNKYHDEHIVSYAYSRYIYRNQDCSRSSWDLITIYKACINDDLFTEVGPGIVNIDQKGVTTFKKDIKGNAYIVKANKENKVIEDKIDDYLCKEVTKHE